jgi:ABC-type transporter Mla MlaB component
MWWRHPHGSPSERRKFFTLNHIGKMPLHPPNGTPLALYHRGSWRSLQMMRISVVQASGQTVTLRVEGEVKGRWVEELRRVSEESLSRQAQLILDLAGVSLIDEDGIALFRLLADRGVVFSNPTMFIAEQLRAFTKA